MIRIKRVYEKPSTTDGLRILEDRVWPRGISKERASIEELGDCRGNAPVMTGP